MKISFIRWLVIFFMTLPVSHAADQPDLNPGTISKVSDNGMPKNIVEKGADWNFGSGSPWTHRGWQYAAW